VIMQILYMNGLHISAILGLPYKQAVISNCVCALMLVVMVLSSPFDIYYTSPVYVIVAFFLTTLLAYWYDGHNRSWWQISVAERTR